MIPGPHLVSIFTVLLGVAAIALSARVEVPMVPVPMTLQTYAVLVLGGLLGVCRAAATLVAYLLLGGLGLPVFADGASGWQHLLGPTAGYLLGFVIAAVVVAWLYRGSGRRPPSRPPSRPPAFVRGCMVMVLGHAVTLGFGVVWLGLSLGFAAACDVGLYPFVLGALVKSILAAWTVHAVPRFSATSSSRATR